MDSIDIEELRTWIFEAGAVARQYFNHVTAHRKANNTPVTEADQAIERLLVEHLRQRYPNHGIIGEEYGQQQRKSDYLWAIDPIDGTAAFIAGLPIWGVSIGLLREGKPYLGMFYVPLMDELYWNAPEGQAFLNSTPIQVAEPHPWDSEDWLAVPSDVHRRYQIDFPGKVRSLGSIAASICYVARGSAAGALFGGSSIWDFAAALAILTAAGGVTYGLRSHAAMDLAATLQGKASREAVIAAQADTAKAFSAIIHETPRA